MNKNYTITNTNQEMTIKVSVIAAHDNETGDNYTFRMEEFRTELINEIDEELDRHEDENRDKEYDWGVNDGREWSTKELKDLLKAVSTETSFEQLGNWWAGQIESINWTLSDIYTINIDIPKTEIDNIKWNGDK